MTCLRGKFFLAGAVLLPVATFQDFFLRHFFLVYDAKKNYKDFTQMLLVNVSTSTKITVYSPFQFIIKLATRSSSIRFHYHEHCDLPDAKPQAIKDNPQVR